MGYGVARKLAMGTLRFDAFGVRGFTRSCAPAIVYKAKQAENIMFSICEPKN